MAIVRLLLEDSRGLDARGSDRAVRAACTGGHLAVLDCLLADARVQLHDSRASAGAAMSEAVLFGGMPVLQRLMADPRIQSSAAGPTFALVAAAHVGDVATVDLLLQHPRVQPANFDCPALRAAAVAGHLAVVERLLADPRIGARARLDSHFVLLHDVVSAGHAAVFERLAAAPALDALTANNLLRPGALGGHLPIVERLLAEPALRADFISCAMVAAAEEGHAEVVARLLRDPRCDTGFEVEFIELKPSSEAAAAALFNACRDGFQAVVECLLADGRFNLTRCAALCVTAAAEGGQEVIVKRLLAHPQVAALFSAEAAAAALTEAQRSPPDAAALSFTSELAEIRAKRLKRLLAGSSDRVVGLKVVAAVENAGVDRVDSDASNLASTAERLKEAFAEAAALGDAGPLRTLLASPVIDPQAPVYPFCDDEGKYCAFEYDGEAKTALCSAAGELACIAARGDASAVGVLLSDPCWEPTQVSHALWEACRADFPAAVERLLADPRVELSTRRTACDKKTGRRTSVFACAAERGHGDVLQLLLSEVRRRRVGRADAGREVLAGLAELHCKYRYPTALLKQGVRARQRDMLRLPSVLHACAAAAAGPAPPLPSVSLPPAWLSRVCVMFDADAVGALAWQRRRHAVATRAHAVARK